MNLRDLVRLPEGAVVEPETLKKAGLIRRVSAPVKILATGDVTRALEIRSCALSAAAEKKIVEAGGKVVEA